ncbi:MAG: hypothetical protein HUJ56_07845, partial [Erysipelotrichaceae bacterium]|nr:hypothetical protein [Erysipelotrichaceae bacterium]
EIVVPIIINDEVFGVLDIDAPIKNRFTQEDAIILEECVRAIEKAILAKEWHIYR